MRGSGFLPRFFICWPQSTQGTRLFRNIPETLTGLETFKSRVIELLKQTTVNNDGLVLSMLSLSAAAFEEWRAFYDEIEKELVADGELSGVREVAAKTADNAARLAVIFHLFEGGAGDISIESMRGACDVAVWHLSESRRFFGALARPPKIADAAKLEAWLIERCRANGNQPVSTRDVLQYGPFQKEKQRRDAAFGVLEEYSRVKCHKDGKQKLVAINPEILSPEADK